MVRFLESVALIANPRRQSGGPGAAAARPAGLAGARGRPARAAEERRGRGTNLPVLPSIY